jgi:hypothetical protein
VIYGDLNRGAAYHQITARDISLNSRSYENPIGVADDSVFLDNVAGVTGSGQTDTKIITLGRITIPNLAGSHGAGCR